MTGRNGVDDTVREYQEHFVTNDIHIVEANYSEEGWSDSSNSHYFEDLMDKEESGPDSESEESQDSRRDNGEVNDNTEDENESSDSGPEDDNSADKENQNEDNK